MGEKQQQEIEALARWHAWRDAARRDEVHNAIIEHHRALDDAVAARQPTCRLSGRCCNFNDFGHRLYVTGLEIAWFVNQLPTERLTPGRQTIDSPCIFQIEKLCTVHDIRPLGCRIFFCQEGTQDWQQEIYESFHDSIKRLHAQFDIAYEYMEWRRGLIDCFSNPEKGGVRYPRGE